MSASPKEGTIEHWAWEYIHTTDLNHKLSPPAPPEASMIASWEESPPSRHVERPGRPATLRIVDRADKTRGLMAASGRARALHTFLHHELQAAELMAWALLAYADAPREFREGLVRIALDETRHMRMYAKEIERLGHHVGEFPVRDWFWTRIPTCKSPASFVAVMGLGLESANLEHTASFAARFRQAGDEEGARVQEIVGREEIAHVRFGARWLAHFSGQKEIDFAMWAELLPPPLTPLLMRGRPIEREARLRAGQPAHFVDALEAWQPSPLNPNPTD